MSKSTILASGQITPSPHHTITVELVDPDGMPATVRIGWPPQPTVINPRRFPELAARVARIFADFTESARVVRARATKYAERMYVSDRFLNRAAALEGFDRIRTRKGRGRYYADRVRQCIDIAGPQFGSLVHDPAKWTTELKDHRDEIAHHYGRRMREETEEQHYISDAAYWLLMFCLLRQASVADATFDKLLAHRKLRSLANKLRAIFAEPDSVQRRFSEDPVMEQALLPRVGRGRLAGCWEECRGLRAALSAVWAENSPAENAVTTKDEAELGPDCGV